MEDEEIVIDPLVFFKVIKAVSLFSLYKEIWRHFSFVCFQSKSSEKDYFLSLVIKPIWYTGSVRLLVTDNN